MKTIRYINIYIKTFKLDNNGYFDQVCREQILQEQQVFMFKWLHPKVTIPENVAFFSIDVSLAHLWVSRGHATIV